MEVQLMVAQFIRLAITRWAWLEQIVGVVIALIAWVIMMILYFVIRKKFAYVKYGVELIFIVGIIVIGAIIKIITSVPILLGLYEIIGSSMSFEGLDNDNTLNLIISLWAGLTFFSIVMARANYEIFSYVSLRVRVERNKSIYIFTALTEDSLCLAKSIKGRHTINRNQNEDDKNPNATYKGKCIIIFAGDDLLPFDRKNPLCREVMANGFYYWSYSDKAGTKVKGKSILRHLHVYNNNTACCDENVKRYVMNSKLYQYHEKKDSIKKSTSKNKLCHAIKLVWVNLIIKLIEYKTNDKQIAIFSYAADGYHPKEELNGENVFNDIENVASEMVNGKWHRGKQLPIIEYHLLTRRDINYEVYQKWLDEAREPFNDKDLGKRMQLCVENEANLAAKDLIEKLKDKCKDGITSVLYPEGPEQFKLMLMGFGGTGQSALSAIYHLTSNIYQKDDMFIASMFSATACDDKIKNYSGLFDANHPYFICKEDDCSDIHKKDGDIAVSMFTGIACGNKIDDSSNAKQTYAICAEVDCVKKHNINKQDELAKKIFKDYTKSGKMPDTNPPRDPARATHDAINYIKNQLQFPEIRFREQSCTSKEFFDMIDKDTGADAKSEYNMFVVALGTDNRNITVANTLIADIKKEYRVNPSSPKKRQIIAVNIRDCRNNPLLDWTEVDEAEFPSLIVIRFGNSCDIYSYQALLDNGVDMEYNHGYNSLYDFVNYNNGKEISYETCNFDACFEKLKEEKKEEPNIDSLNDFCKYMINQPADKNENAKYSWLNVKLFQKESNNFAVQFKEIFFKKYYDDSAKDDVVLKELCALEHHRWCRFHIAAGWEYSYMADTISGAHSKNKELKLHNNLIPFEMLKVNQLLDVINVAKSIYPKNERGENK